MLIECTGMDPSYLHWGLANILIDVLTGIPNDPTLLLLEPKELEGKQIRVNSNDLFRTEQLASGVFTFTKTSKVIFAEVPVGSQNARSMASYGICVGILGSLRASGKQIIEVSAGETKRALTGNSNASKADMINAAFSIYPNANWPRQERNGAKHQKGDLMKTAEHLADAIATIHAGVNTPLFRNLIQLYQG